MLLEYFLLVLAYLAASLDGDAGGSSLGGLPGPVWAAAAVAVSLGLSRLVAHSLERRLARGGGDWAGAVNEVGRGMALLRVAVLVLFAFSVHPGGFGAYVDEALDLSGLPVLREGAILAPFAASWLGLIVFLRRLEGGEGAAGPYLRFRARSVCGLLALLLAAGGVVDLLFGSGAAGAWLRSQPGLQGAAAGALAVAAVAGVPLFLRVIWSTRPLGDGDLGRALGEFSRASAFRFREVRVWETGGLTVLNAAVAGLFAPLRTVFLTRGLLEHLKPREVLAVFAHEVGHAKGAHAVFTSSLAVGWGGLVLGVGSVEWLGPGAGLWAARGMLTALFVAQYAVLARRLESAADLWAAAALKDPQAVGETLTRVAMLNGDVRALQSLTHGSVAQRVAFLRAVASDPREGDRFRLGLRILQGVAVALGALGIAAGVPSLLR